MRAILTLATGRIIEADGEAVEVLYQALHKSEGAFLSPPIGWLGTSKWAINMAHVEMIQFVKEDVEGNQ